MVQEENPDLVVLAWCFSTNGDVCMDMRRNAILSRMIVEAEMRNIEIEDAELDSDQVEVLKKAEDPTIKDIILTGGTGSGKTIIGAEVVKIWMARHETSVRTPYFFQRSYILRRPQNLLFILSQFQPGLCLSAGLSLPALFPWLVVVVPRILSARPGSHGHGRREGHCTVQAWGAYRGRVLPDSWLWSAVCQSL